MGFREQVHLSVPQNPPAPQQDDPCNAIIAQFPESGQGYYAYGAANERYGRGEVISTLVNFASGWNQEHPDNPIGVGDISLRGGGDIAGHLEHEEGLQVDIRPMRNDNTRGATNFNAGTYSFDLTNSLYTAREQERRATSPITNSGQLEPRIKLSPVDEGRQDRSFERFRNSLLEAVRRNDSDFLLKVLHTKIENGYDVKSGVDEFKKRWEPQDPESPVWSVLSTALTSGGSFTKRADVSEFCGPYVVNQWPTVLQQLPRGIDSLDFVAITGDDVAVYLEPKVTAPIVTRLSYDVVRSIPNAQVTDRTNPKFSSWIKIRTPDGKEGYVPDSDVQGPMDYGTCLRQTNGKWLITKLAATE